MLRDSVRDLRYGFHRLRRAPGFTAATLITLALGIGANTAIFSVVNAVLLRPLPYVDPDRLVWLWDTQPQLANAPAALPDFIDWKEQNRSFEYLAAFQTGNMFVDGDEGAQDAAVGLVTPDLFSLFRVKPLLGRTFTEEETLPGRSRVALLSDSMWQRRFGSDPHVLGRTIQLSGADYTIIGVIPGGFNFPNEAQLWRPLPVDPNHLNRGPHYLRVIGRLRPGVTLAQAQAEMSAIASRLAQQYPDVIAGHGIKLDLLRDVVVGDIGPALLVLLGAVGFVLLIACANVTNLQLASAGARQKEIAVRTALGASRARIIRQLLTESVLLATIGGAAGLLVAVWGVDSLISLNPGTIPRIREIGIDARVMSFTLFISIFTGVASGIAPALQVSKRDSVDPLKEGGRTTAGVGRNRFRSLLVVSEIAMSLVLLIGAGLMIKDFATLTRVDPGFNPSNVVTMGVTLLRSKYPNDEQVAALYPQMIERLAAVPGVASAGAIAELPLSGSSTSDYFTIEGRPPIARVAQPLTECRTITPHYFESMGIPLLRGRDFAEIDTKQTPNVAVINESFARKYFSREDPLGHRIRLQGQARDPLLIVGVVGNVRDLGLEQEPSPEVYFPYLQNPLGESYNRSMILVVRTKSDRTDMIETLRRNLLLLDRTLPVYALRPMSDYLRDALSRRRFNMALLGVFSTVALLLAAVGIYGVISYSVAQRTHEIGIRVAIGAQTRDVMKLVMGQAARLTMLGIFIGLTAALALTRLLKSLLFEVSATDPLTFAALAVLLTGVALAACLVPARRAVNLDPMVALRNE